MGKKKAEKKLVNHVAIILDSSGSMAAMEKEAREAFNEQVETLKADAKKGDMDYTITLTTFSSAPHPIKIFAAPVKQAKKLTEADYQPGGMTAMLDAVAVTVDRMESEIKDIREDHVSALVIVISDGVENNSQEHTFSSLATIIKRLQDTGRWTFSYMGANQDLADVSKNLGIPQANTMAFAATPAGMAKGAQVTASALTSYSTSRRAGAKSVAAFYRLTND